MKSMILVAALLFSVSSFASAKFTCSSSLGTVSGVINADESATISLDGVEHEATGHYKVYAKGQYCAKSDVTIAEVFANDSSMGIQSISGDTCTKADGTTVVVNGKKAAGTCTFTQE